MRDSKNQYDVIIVGSGLVGLALACMLQGSGLSIGVIDKTSAPSSQKKNLDYRPISLNYASMQVLKTLGICLESSSEVASIDSLHVSLQSCFGSFEFVPDQLGVSYLGYVVPYGELVRLLYIRAEAAGVKFLFDSTVTEINMTDSEVDLQYTQANTDSCLIAPLLIAADGKNSFCRDYFNISIDIKQTQYQSKVFHLHLAGQHKQRAYQRFTQMGTMAIVPLYAPDQVRLVLTYKPGLEYPQTMTEWGDLFNQVYEGYLPDILRAEETGNYPLSKYQVMDPLYGRCVLMGNAAYNFYPITAQGFNSSLLDCAALAQLIMYARSDEGDIGQSTLLREYVDWRVPMQKKTVSLTHAVASVFDGGCEFDFIKGMGLSIFDNLFGLKKEIGRHFLGLSGKVPKLALGVPLVKSQVVL